MLVQFDCYECILTQVVKLAGAAGRTDVRRRELLNEFLEFVRNAAGSSTPPEMAAYFYEVYRRESGIDDPYAEEKRRSTELALGLMAELTREVENSADPFLTALKFAIGGNVIDYGVNPDFDLSCAAKAIREVSDLAIDLDSVTELKRRIGRAEKILYILDNCGEAVLDRLLLEFMRGKVTVGVRGAPILNDVTRRETGLSNLADFPLIDTGDGTPGVSLRRASREFAAAMEEADLVIAKGQGNFESLEGNFTASPVYFLFRAKCPVIQRYLHAEAGSLQIRGYNLSEADR